MFKGVTAAAVSDYCRNCSEWLLSSREEDHHMARSIGSQKFFEAVLASDTVCAIARDWPAHLIHRSSPFIICALWAPACIQLLVKAFATSNWELREKASLSLQILTFAMEQFAEYWGLGHVILCMCLLYFGWESLPNCHYQRPSEGTNAGSARLYLMTTKTLEENLSLESGFCRYPAMLTMRSWMRLRCQVRTKTGGLRSPLVQGQDSGQVL
jgi:hypothetical protein